MRKYAAILIVFLTGCQTIPEAPKFPGAVPELTKPCPQLKTVHGEKVAITELLKTVVENYETYYECAKKVDSWNKWYREQKETYEKK